MTVNRMVPYQYIILRYVHDVVSAEFLNIGAIVLTLDGKFIGAKFKKSVRRLKSAFPSLSVSGYSNAIVDLQKTFDLRSVEVGGLFAIDYSIESVETVATAVLPRDDSSLQWSPPGSGITSDPEATLQQIYSRFITKHDSERTSSKKKDEDVWRSFKGELEKRSIVPEFGEKVISVSDDSVKFGHAWKNGSWHCYEGISFDLSAENSIKEKAVKWFGQVSSVSKADDKFNVYFIVAKPKNADLENAYLKAVSMLNRAPGCEVIEEENLQRFSDHVAAKFSEHQQNLQ